MGRCKWSYKSPNQGYIYGYPTSTPSNNYPRTSKRGCLGFGVEGCFGVQPVQASGIKVSVQGFRITEHKRQLALGSMRDWPGRLQLFEFWNLVQKFWGYSPKP